jgi:exopolysaccharide production protein ExoY
MKSPPLRAGDGPDATASECSHSDQALCGSPPNGYPLKRVVDVVGSAAILVLLLPVGILVIALVGLGGGPVFYIAQRRGAGGRPFRMYKFRTMVPDADAMLADHLERDQDARALYRRAYKIERDPRVTRVGRFLRRYSLDELPQLVNVLRGDMSLVGPRPRGEPEFAEEAAHGGPLFDAYYLCRPGMTGLWQVSGRSATDYQTRMRLDADYARSLSLWQDLAILARTVPAALVGRGAY